MKKSHVITLIQIALDSGRLPLSKEDKKKLRKAKKELERINSSEDSISLDPVIKMVGSILIKIEPPP